MPATPQPKLWLIIDFEATCDKNNALPSDEMEIIEFGVVIIDNDTLDEVESFQSFVKPSRHKALTAFCTELTGITQAHVDAAPPFPQVLDAFIQWLSPYAADSLFSSWGNYDKHQLAQDCRLHNRTNPLVKRHVNLKSILRKNQHMPHKFGLDYAVGRAGLTFAGRHHRGIDDARNIGRLMPYILGRQKLPPEPPANSEKTPPQGNAPGQAEAQSHQEQAQQ